MKSALVIVSHYNAWPTDLLISLLDQMGEFPSGHPFRCLIVVNQAIDKPLELPERHADKEVLYRENTGYNIGAWEHGWRTASPAESYLFLQEECQIRREGWLAGFLDPLSKPEIGLVGESMAWPGQTWKRAYDLHAGLYYLGNPGDPPIGHVDGVRRFLASKGIPFGETGEHLQSFILATRREVIEAIDGFRIGQSKGDAVSCEVAISRAVASKGWKIRQVGPSPFRYILHPQWIHLAEWPYSNLVKLIEGHAPIPSVRRLRNSVLRLRKLMTGQPCVWGVRADDEIEAELASTPAAEVG